MPFWSCFRGRVGRQTGEPPHKSCSVPQLHPLEQDFLAKPPAPKRVECESIRANSALAHVAAGNVRANEPFISLVHELSTLEGGWWSALSEGCQAICECLDAGHVCVYVLSAADFWAATAACAGVGASTTAGRAFSSDPRFNGSAAAAILRARKHFPSQLLVFGEAPRGGGGGGGGGTSSRCSTDTASVRQPDELPGDWQLLEEEHGMSYFVAVALTSGVGEPIGVLSLAAKGSSRPASWSPEALHCVVGLLSTHIRRAQLVLASSALSQLHTASTLSDVVNSVAEAALDVAAAVVYVRGQSRVAFIGADIGAAAIFQQQQQQQSQEGDPLASVPLLKARRSGCEFVMLPGNLRKSTTTTTFPWLSMDGLNAMGERAVTITADGCKPDVWRTHQVTANGNTSFTLNSAKGAACKGHTLTLHKTLLGEALSKQVAGLCIDDCQAYTMTTKAYPRDLVLSRGALMPTSLALATISDHDKPLMALYVTFGAAVARPLLQAVVQELQQLLQAILPTIKAKLSGALQAEYDFLGTQLQDATLRRINPAAVRAPPGVHVPSGEQVSDKSDPAVEDADGVLPQEVPQMVSFLLRHNGPPARATGLQAVVAAAAAAAASSAERPSPSCAQLTPVAAAGQSPARSTGRHSGSNLGSLRGRTSRSPTRPAGGGGTLQPPGAARSTTETGAAAPPCPLEGDLEMSMATRRGAGQLLGRLAEVAARAQSACESSLGPKRLLLNSLAADSLTSRSVSFHLEAAQAPRGASKLAPIIASMHDRLKAAQAVQMTTGRSEARKADLQSLKLLQEIGQGGYGTVYRAMYHGAEVAVKVIKQSRLANVHSSSNALVSSNCLGLHKQNLHDAIELVASVSMSHTNIVQVPAYFMDVRLEKPEEFNPLDSVDAPTESRPFRLTHTPSLIESSAPCQDMHGSGEGAMALVLEYCDCGSLCDAIMTRKFVEKVTPKKDSTVVATKTYLAINMRSVYSTLLEVALALRHMHSLALVHCDLKPQNVLLKSSPRDPRGFTAKLSDFGLAKMMAHDDEGQMVIDEAVASGTITHVAPEVLLGGQALGAAVDIYAFGILMYQVLCGMKVYDNNMSASTIANAVAHRFVRPQLPSWVPSNYRTLAQACWDQEPSERPTADELVGHLERAIESKRGGSTAASRSGRQQPAQQQQPQQHLTQQPTQPQKQKQKPQKQPQPQQQQPQQQPQQLQQLTQPQQLTQQPQQLTQQPQQQPQQPQQPTQQPATFASPPRD